MSQGMDGLVLYQGRIYVPLDGQLRHDIVATLHGSPIMGHSSQWKTMDLVACNFWWPGMGHYVVEYVKGCDLCNHTKTFPTPLTGQLMPNRVPDCHWKIISVDLIMELPQSHGYDAIIVVSTTSPNGPTSYQ